MEKRQQQQMDDTDTVSIVNLEHIDEPSPT